MNAAPPSLEVVPVDALVDEPVAIQLRHFPPHISVMLRAETHDDLQHVWRASATFVTDLHGRVDVRSQRPQPGTYDVIDPMGLFWSMVVDPPGANLVPFTKTTLTPATVTLTAAVDATVVTSATITRRFIAPDVSRTSVRAQGLAGTLFTPAGAGPFPGLLVLGGSEGGLTETRAALLACHGYAALALAYFAFEHLPANLATIPLEYFETALRWLQTQDVVMADRVGVLGGSRGGELALLLGATFSQITAVVAYVPSSVLWGAVGASEQIRGASWSHQGAPLPYVPEDRDEQDAPDEHPEPIALTPGFLRSLRTLAAVEAATIPVERTRGPILLISGEDDQMWPSSLFAEMVMRRLEQHRYPYPFRHLSYPGAGHLIRFPFQPTTVTAIRHPIVGKVFAVGGAPAANAFATADSWAQVLAFLRQSLGGETSGG